MGFLIFVGGMCGKIAGNSYQCITMTMAVFFFFFFQRGLTRTRKIAVIGVGSISNGFYIIHIIYIYTCANYFTYISHKHY